MAAPTWQTNGGAVQITSASFALTHPSGLVAGDYELAFVEHNGTALGAAPSGWTEVSGAAVSGGTNITRGTAYYRQAAGGETGSVTFSGHTGATQGIGHIQRIAVGTAGDTLEFFGSSWIDTNSANTTFGGTGANAVTSNTDSLWIHAATARTTTGTYNGNATGLTFSQATGWAGAMTARFAGRSGSPTNTMYYGLQTATVTTGGTGAPTFSSTIATATSATSTGIGIAVLARKQTAVTKNDTPADNLPLSDSLAVVNEVVRNISDALGLTDTVQIDRGSSGNAAPADALGLTDSLTVEQFSHAVLRDSFGVQGSSTVPATTIVRPGTVQDGDYCFIVTMAGGGSGASAAPTQGALPWDTLVPDTQLAAGNARVAIYGGRYTTGDADPIVTYPSAPGSGNNTASLALWYSGVTQTPIAGSLTVGAASLTWSTGSKAISGPDRTVLCIAGLKGSGTGFAATTSWAPDAIERADRIASGNFYPTLTAADFVMAAAGSAPAQTATFDFSSASAFALQIELPSGGQQSSSTSDTVNLSDSMTAQWSFAPPLTDALGLSDSLAVLWDRVRAVADQLDLTDPNVATAVDTTLSDTLGLTDSMTAVTQSPSVAFNPNDPLGLTDSMSTSQGRSDAPADALGLTDAPDFVRDQQRAQSDALGLSDDPQQVAQRDRVVTDSLGLTDSVVVVRTGSGTLGETLNLSDAMVVTWGRVANVDDSLGLADSATKDTSKVVTIADSVGLGDDSGFLIELPTGNVQLDLGETLGLMDAQVYLAVRPRSQADALGLSDQMDAITTTDISDTKADPVGLSDAVVFERGIDRVRADVLSMSDSMSVVWQRQRTIDDGLGIGDATTEPLAMGRALADSLPMSDEVDRLAERERAIFDALGFSDQLSVTRGADAAPFIDQLNLFDVMTVVILTPDDGTYVDYPVMNLVVNGHETMPGKGRTAIVMTEGDTAPEFVGQLNASLVNAAVRLHFLKPSNELLDVATEILDPINGVFLYDWQAGDLDEAGLWTVEAEVTFSDGEVETFRLDKKDSFRVRRQYA